VIRGGEELTVSKEEPFEIRNGDFVVFPQEHKFKVIIKNQGLKKKKNKRFFLKQIVNLSYNFNFSLSFFFKQKDKDEF